MLGHYLRECMLKVPRGSELKVGPWLKATPHVFPLARGARYTEEKRDSKSSRSQKGCFESGNWDDVDVRNDRRKGVSSDAILATIPLGHVEEVIKGALCSNNKTFHQGNKVGSCSAEEYDEVAKVDANIGIGKMVIKEIEDDKAKFSEGGLSSRPGQSVDVIGENLMEVKVDVMDTIVTQSVDMGCQNKASRRWKRVAKSPS
ncbi:hypothetical protein ACOSQ4_007890 [Xanthoceras sorbifolium]